MEPIRVLQVVTIMNRGGLETMLMNYYRKVDRNKIQFDFMVHREERGDYDDEIEALGGKIFRMSPIKPGNYRNYFKQLDNFFKENKEYKVVHSHINENSGFVLRSAKKYNVPCRIAHSHLADLKLDYKFPFRLYGRHYLNPNVTEYFACSKDAGKWLFKNPKKEIIVLNNAVDTELFSPNENIRQKIRRNLNIEDKFVIGHVGRFNPQKNHTFLIDVFKEIKKIKDNAELILIGQGYLFDEVKEKVNNLGLQDSVKFLGLRTDIPELMQGMDLFLFPSLFEGLPVVLVEAQAAGLKCVTSTGVTKETDITDSLEFYDLNETPEKWAEKIVNLDTRKRNNSKLLNEKGYDSSTNIKWLVDFYSKYYI